MLKRIALRCLLAALIIGAVATLIGWQSSHSGTSAGSPTGFVADAIVGGLSEPTDFAFAPDGRVFVALRSGDVLVYDASGGLLDTFISLPDVNTLYFRGLLGLELDPEFATNGFVYLYYVYENDPAAPEASKTARLVRVTADGNTALPGSEAVLAGSAGGDAAHRSCRDLPVGADCIPADSVDHYGGGLRFAPDGSLFLTTGDAVRNMTEVQQLDALAGKVLRLNADGTGFDNNPYHTGNPAANRSKVWAYGLRNPFRLAVQPSTGLPFVGDVGSFFWEEINIAASGANLGWPCYEGTAPQVYQTNLPVCVALYQSDQPVAHPVHLYANLVLSGQGSAVIAGEFYQGSTYPPDYDGALFFGDFAQETIKALRLNAANEPIDDEPEAVLNDAGNVVAIRMGPGGDIYYLTYGALTGVGDLNRLRYQPGNRNPVANASAQPQGGLAPLSVQFSAAGSYDPEGEPLLYGWDFGDTTSSANANPSHTYPANGKFTATLTVEDSEGAIDTTTVDVVVGDQPPAAVIEAPRHGFAYQPGQLIPLAGFGTDAKDGTLPGASLLWKVIEHHCEPLTGGCHSHLYGQGQGSATSIFAPGQAFELYYLEVILTATDSAGLKHSTSVIIGPDSDRDGILDQDELAMGTERFVADTDGDGCLDGAELTTVPWRGGMRDPLDFWDFYDTPNASGQRDGTVALGNDIFSVMFRFGANDRDGTAPVNRGTDPLTVPPPRPSYHPAFDRSQPGPGSAPWETGPADGTIDLVNDIFRIVRQFGHHCT